MIFGPIRRFFMPLNRWYDDLDEEHGVLRMMIFFVFVGLPIMLLPILLETHPNIAIALFLFGGTLGMIRITAFL